MGIIVRILSLDGRLSNALMVRVCLKIAQVRDEIRVDIRIECQHLRGAISTADPSRFECVRGVGRARSSGPHHKRPGASDWIAWRNRINRE